MSIWQRYSEDQREQYIQFLKVYGALSNLFRQKQGSPIPHLDSKFQETVFAKIFNGQVADIGNTPHDIVSTFDDGTRVGIGLKTWMDSRPSFQKVMQLKSFKDEIDATRNNTNDLALKISEIKNDRIKRDYIRLGLNEEGNIYHYITRNKGVFKIHECTYPLVDLNNLRDFNLTNKSFSWGDGLKEYRYTFGDSQIFQKFDSAQNDTRLLKEFDILIMDDPFSFLLDAYTNLATQASTDNEIEEVFLPLYSYQTKEVENKSGLNAWNAAPKNRNSNIPRPLNEIYIPIPREFHRQYPSFFTNDILELERERLSYIGIPENKPEARFHLRLPNGKQIPALVTQSSMKALQSGSSTERDENGVLYGQSALGQWLLVDVLGLDQRQPVTREWLTKKGTDSVRLWKTKGDYSIINIDFARTGSFEAFMNGIPIVEEE